MSHRLINKHSLQLRILGLLVFLATILLLGSVAYAESDLPDGSFATNSNQDETAFVQNEQFIDETYEDASDESLTNNGPIDKNCETGWTNIKHASPELSETMLNTPFSGVNESNDDSPFIDDNLIWTKLNEEKVDESQSKDLSIFCEYNNEQSHQFQMTFDLPNDYRLEKGDLVFSFDAQPWKDRDGNPIGSMNLSVPEAPSDAQTFVYTYDATNNKYLVSNSKVLQSSASVGMQFTITKLLPVNILDETSIDFYVDYHANINGEIKEGKFGGDLGYIKAKFDTSEHLENAMLQDGKVFDNYSDARFYGLPSKWVEGKINPNDYWFVKWSSSVSVEGCKYFSLKFNCNLKEEDKDKYDALMLGAEDDVHYSTYVQGGDESYVFKESGSYFRADAWMAVAKNSVDPETVDSWELTYDFEWELTEEKHDASQDPVVHKLNTNEATAQYILPISYTIEIEWEDVSEEYYPETVDFYLFANHQSYGTYTLKKSDNWKLTIENLPGQYEYRVYNDPTIRWFLIDLQIQERCYSKFYAKFHDPNFSPLLQLYYSGVWNSEYKTPEYTDQDQVLRDLSDGKDASLEWDTAFNAPAMALTLEDGKSPKDPDSYNIKKYKLLQKFSMDSFIDEAPLLPEDYDINGFCFESVKFFTQKYERGLNPFKVAYEPSEYPNIDFYGNILDDGSTYRQLLVTAEFDSVQKKYVLKSKYEGVSVNDNTVSFDFVNNESGKKILTMEHEIISNVSEIDLVVSYNTSLHATENIKNLLIEKLNSETYVTEYVRSSVNMYVYKDISSTSPYEEAFGYEDAYLHGHLLKAAPRILCDNKWDLSGMNFNIAYNLSYVLQTNALNKEELQKSASDGDLPNINSGINTWYCLLPYGTSIDFNSINNPSDEDKTKWAITDTSMFGKVEQVNIFSNYKDSSYNLLVVKTTHDPYLTDDIKRTCGLEGIQNTENLFFKLNYSTDVYVGLKNPNFILSVANESCSDWVGNVSDFIGEADSCEAEPYNHCDTKNIIEPLRPVMSGLHPDKIPSNNFIYNSNEEVLDIQNFSWHNTFAKQIFQDVQLSNKYSALTGGGSYVREGSPYKYLLKFQQHIAEGRSGVQEIGDMVLVDTIERCAEHSEEDSFYGIFDSIDTTQLDSMGAFCKVFVSKDADDSHKNLYKTDAEGVNYLDSNNLSEYDSGFAGSFAFADDTSWVELSSLSDDEKKDVKSIAVDFTHKGPEYSPENKFFIKTTEGSSIFESIESFVYINMTAPSGEAAKDIYSGDGLNPDENKHAYNLANLHCYTKENDGTGQKIYRKNENAYQLVEPTKLSIVKTNIDVNVTFDDDSDRDGVRTETGDVVFNLINPEGDIVSSKELTVADDNNYQFAFEGVPFADENGPINYSVVQDGIGEDYEAFIDRSFDEDYVTSFSIVDKYYPLTTEITGTINWYGDQDNLGARPDSVSVKLTGDDIVPQLKVIKTSDSNSQEFKFENVYVYYNHGESNVYNIQQPNVVDYRTQYTPSSDFKNWTIDNNYYPFGELKVVNDEYEDATAAALSIKHTFTFNLFDEVTGNFVFGDFIADIYSSEGDIVEPNVSISTGDTFELGSGQYIVIHDVTSRTVYEILETAKNGFELIKNINSTNTIYSYLDQTVEFQNKYSSIGWFTLFANKITENAIIKQYQFAFDLYKYDNETKDWVYFDAQTNGAPDSSGHQAVAQFQSRKITNQDIGTDSSVTIKYKMNERANPNPKGYEYDTSEYEIDIVAQDNGDGTIDLDYKFRHIFDGKTEEASSIEFTNVYDAKGSFSPKSWVKLVDGSLTENQFTFNLFKVKETENPNTFEKDYDFTDQTKSNDAEGCIDFKPSANKDAIEYGISDVGKDYYYIIEQTDFTSRDVIDHDGDPELGDNNRIGVKVSVSDNGDGTLGISYKYISFVANLGSSPVVYTTNEDIVKSLFTNKCKPGNLELSKHGVDIPADNPSFDFDVYLTGENVPDTIEYEIVKENDTDSFSNNAVAEELPVTESSGTTSSNEPENIFKALSSAMPNFGNLLAGNSNNNDEDTLTADPVYSNLICQFDGIDTLTFKGVNDADLPPAEEEGTGATPWWHAEDTKDSKEGDDAPGWRVYTSWGGGWEDAGKVKNVEFDESCKNAPSPTSCAFWFASYSLDSDIDLHNLNYSNTVTLRGMFENFTGKKINAKGIVFPEVTTFVSFGTANNKAHINEVDFSDVEIPKVNTMSSFWSGSTSSWSHELCGNYNFSHIKANSLTTIASEGMGYYFDASKDFTLDFSYLDAPLLTTFEFFDITSQLESKDKNVHGTFKFDLSNSNIPNLNQPISKLCPTSSSSYYDKVIIDLRGVNSAVFKPSMYHNDKIGESKSNFLLLVDEKWGTDAVSGEKFATNVPNLVGNNGFSISTGAILSSYAIVDTPLNQGVFSTMTKAVFNKLTGELVFYNSPDNYKTDDTEVYPVYSTVVDPSWELLKDKVKSVKFDSSFADFHPQSTKDWFNGFSKLESIDLANLNISEATDLTNMFKDCPILGSVNIPAGFRFYGKDSSLAESKQANMPSVQFPLADSWSNSDKGWDGKTAAEVKSYIDGASQGPYVGLWTAAKNSTDYKVNYLPNGGTGELVSDLVAASSPYTIKSCTYDGGSWSFLHWEDDAANSYDPSDVLAAGTIEAGSILNLNAIWGKSSSGEIKDGKVHIQLHAGEKAVFKNLPNNTHYEIIESSKDQYKLDECVNEVGDIASTETSSSTFTNSYNPDYHSTSLDIKGMVYYNDVPASNSQFKFSLDTIEDSFSATEISNQDGGIIPVLTNTWDDASEEHYQLKQVVGADTSIAYDESIYDIDITITKNADNSLTPSVVYKKGDLVVDSPVFKNYKKPGSVKFSNSYDDTLHTGPAFGYVFALNNPTGDKPTSIKYKINDGSLQESALTDGAFSFSLNPNDFIEFVELADGLNYDISSESVPSGWKILSQTNLSGKVSGATTVNANVVLSYVTAGTCDIEAKVHINGKVLETGEFAFQLFDSADNPVGDPVKNGDPDLRKELTDEHTNPYYNSASFSFGAVEFTSADTFNYIIKQVDLSHPNIYVYDTTVCYVTVTATDNEDGTLSCNASYSYNHDEDKLFFENSLQSGSLTFTSNVENATSAAANVALEYQIDLFDINGAPLDGTFTCSPDASGSTIIKHGQHFTLKDQNQIVIEGLPVLSKYSIVSVGNESGFTVKNYDNEPLTNKTSSTGTIDKDTPAIGNCLQSYFTTGSLAISASVVLNGAFLDKDMFSYSLNDASAIEIDRTKNNQDGSIVLNAGDFSNDSVGKTLHFNLVQDSTNPIDNILYDTSKYSVEVTPTDSGSGNIEFSCVYYKDGTILPSGQTPKFVNTYQLTEMPFTGALGFAIPIIVIAIIALAYRFFKSKSA